MFFTTLRLQGNSGKIKSLFSSKYEIDEKAPTSSFSECIDVKEMVFDRDQFLWFYNI